MNGEDVILKFVPSDGPEVKIYKHLGTPECRSDPHNHSLPVLDFISCGEWTILVLPRCVHEHSPEDLLKIGRQTGLMGHKQMIQLYERGFSLYLNAP